MSQIDNYERSFQALRKILKSHKALREMPTENQITYKDEYGAVVMLRKREQGIVVAFGRGAKLQEKFPMLQGSGKVVRHLLFQTVEESDEKLIGEMIEESLVLGIEAVEMKRIRARLT